MTYDQARSIIDDPQLPRLSKINAELILARREAAKAKSQWLKNNTRIRSLLTERKAIEADKKRGRSANAVETQQSYRGASNVKQWYEGRSYWGGGDD
jgi:uncharacterized protein with WD repeat